MIVPRACPQCLRRSWLLSQVAPYIERIHPPAADVARLLCLDDERLAEAVAPDVAAAILAGTAAIPERRFAEELEAARCWATCCHDDLYPRALADIDGAPPALIGRGDPIHLVHRDPAESAAVVGSRRATSYGREVARQLGQDLAAAGVTVISGLAFGVDACAHRGALDAGRTIAVLGCGPDIAYPAAHRSLWRRTCEERLILSELLPGAPPWRWTLVWRKLFGPIPVVP